MAAEDVISEDEIYTYLTDQFKQYLVDETGEKYWVVLVDGKRIEINQCVTFPSRKSASAQFTGVLNHLEWHVKNKILHKIKETTGVWPNAPQIKEAEAHAKLLRNNWKESHVEFITLKEWEERNEVDPE